MLQKGRLPITSALRMIISIIMRIDFGWLMPEWNFSSMLFYVGCVYPLIYIIVWKLWLAPFYDLGNFLAGWIAWFAGLWGQIKSLPSMGRAGVQGAGEKGDGTSEKVSFLFDTVIKVMETIKCSFDPSKCPNTTAGAS